VAGLRLGCHATVTVIQQGQASEAKLFPALVEDRGAGGAGAMGYADFLIQLHRQVAQTQVGRCRLTLSNPC